MPFRLRDQPFAVRLGLTGVVLSLLLGVGASLGHIERQHRNRDERPGHPLRANADIFILLRDRRRDRHRNH